MSDLQQLILQLSVAERLQLISFIASSISERDAEKPFQVPEEWVEEAVTRGENYTSNPEGGQSWKEVQSRVYGKH